MIHYLAPLLAFLAALVGVLGNTHDAKKKGLRRLTRVGWATAILAAAALALGIWTTWKQDAEQRVLGEQRRYLNDIGTRELCAAALHLKAAFDILHAAATRETLESGADLGFSFDALTSNAALNAMHSLDLLKDPPGRPRAGDGRPAWLLAHQRADNFYARANSTLAKYGDFLDIDLVVLASQVINDNYVQSLLELPSNVEHMKQIQDSKLPPLQASEDGDFRQSISRVWTLFARVHGDPVNLLCEPIEGDSAQR